MDVEESVISASELSYATPPMASSPLVPGFSEDKENRPPVEVIDLTGDSEDEEEVPDRAEDSCQGHSIPTALSAKATP